MGESGIRVVCLDSKLEKILAVSLYSEGVLTEGLYAGPRKGWVSFLGPSGRRET